MPATFTIAIPTHNRAATLVLAARSALAQTRPPDQLIVLCDGCTDQSAEAVRALGDDRLEVLDLPKLPGYGYDHRNRALECARGEAIVYLGDDDLLLPDHLERLGEYWDTGAFDIVGTPAVAVMPNETMIWFGADWSVPAYRRFVLERRNTNVMASVSVRVALAREVGGWDGSLPREADWDLWKRTLAAGARPAMTSEPTVLHFRATGREQTWTDRVRQNTAWFERISDQGRLAELRHELRRARSERDAGLLDLELELDRLRGIERELELVHAGGWWRLRSRLLPVLRLLRRGS